MERHNIRNGALVVLLTTAVCGSTAFAKLFPERKSTQIAHSAKSSPKVRSSDWLHDLQVARRVSAATGRPMLLVFGGPQCVYCRKLENEVLNDPKMADFIRQGFVPVHLDIYKDERAAKILEVKQIPTSIILSPNADLLGSIEGFVTVTPYLDVLKQSLEFQKSLR